MRVLACTRRCVEIIQHEQNPLARILLAYLLETRANPFFLLIRRELEDTLTIECIEPGRWCVNFHHRPGDGRLSESIEPLGIIPWLRVKGIEKGGVSKDKLTTYLRAFQLRREVFRKPGEEALEIILETVL